MTINIVKWGNGHVTLVKTKKLINKRNLVNLVVMLIKVNEII